VLAPDICASTGRRHAHRRGSVPLPTPRASPRP
jgi:hypothetical protein